MEHDDELALMKEFISKIEVANLNGDVLAAIDLNVHTASLQSRWLERKSH